MIFDPYDLDLDVTPLGVRQQLRLRKWAAAIVLAFRLNEDALKQEVLESVPLDQGRSRPISSCGGGRIRSHLRSPDLMLSVIVSVVCSSLSDVYVEKVLNFVAFSVECSAHLQFYLTWAQQLLLQHTHKLKNRLVPLMPLARFCYWALK